MTDFFKFRNSLEEAKCGSKNTKREEEKLDPVGKADADIDNDGDVIRRMSISRIAARPSLRQ